jgi:FHA domain-containing protein
MADTSDPPPLRTVHRIGYALDLPVVRPRHPELADRHWLFVDQRRFHLAAGENVVGRDPASAVWLAHATLSRRHARIILTEGRAVLEDLGSKNGTRLHGVAVLQPTSLRNCDEFICGHLTLRYVDSANAPATETLLDACVLAEPPR